MSEHLRECEAIRQLWIEEATGRTPAADELALRERHVARCAACRVEAEAIARLADPDAPGPAPRLDDLARRRWVDQAFERAERALTDQVVERAGKRAPVVRIAAIAAAAVLAVGAGIFFSRGTEAPRAPVASAPVSVASRAAGRILLSSGDVSIAAASDLAAGELGVGSGIATGAGTAVAALDGGVTLELAPQSSLKIVRVEPNAVEVRLETGGAIFSVDPGRKGRGFRVAAGDGAVRVTGTIFSVSHGAGGSSVSVFRGGVVVEGKGSERPVRLGERLDFSATAAVPVSEEEKARAMAAMDAMSALAPVGAAQLEVESMPTGAVVAVDGVEIGATPFTAALRPGYRRLELRLEGRETVREFLRLAADGKTSRVFDLVPLGPGEAPAAEVVTTEEIAPSAAGKSARENAPRVPSPEELVATARDLRAGRDFTGAIQAYERLVAAYPETPVTRAALVSLGQLYLDQGGNPGRALEVFRRYLGPSRRGPLAPEAAFGVARAQRALGDTAAEIAALEGFLDDFGDSNQAPRAAARLEELR